MRDSIVFLRKLTTAAMVSAALWGLPQSAEAAQAKRPSNDLPRLEDVRPLPATPRLYREPFPGFLHDFVVSIDGGYAKTSNKQQPNRLRQESGIAQLGVSFEIGQSGFAAVGGTFSREYARSSVVSFPINLKSRSDVGGGTSSLAGDRCSSCA